MKIQSPWMGRIKGSAGNMTGCKVYDKNVMRAKAFEVSNPKTPAQQTQRAFFASLTDLCSDFSEAQLRTLFPAKPKTMSRRNAISKQIAQSNTMDGTDKVIDFSNIDTLGNASVMDFGVTTCAVDGGAFKVSLDNSVKQNQELANNDFICAMVNVTKGEISLTPSCAAVSVGVLTPAIPTTWSLDDEVNAIPLITNSKDGQIALVGFGTMIVYKRPYRKGTNS